MTNYYKILGVPDFSTPDEIKKAFRKLSKKFHPDVNDGDEFFANKFRELKEAYDFLMDDSKRSSLDQFLRNGASSHSYQENIKESESSKQKKDYKEDINSESYKNPTVNVEINIDILTLLKKIFKKLNIKLLVTKLIGFLKYQTNKLTRKNYFQFGIVVALIFGIFVGINFFKKYLVKKENEKIEREQFIKYYNSLSPEGKLGVHYDSIFNGLDQTKKVENFTFGSSAEQVMLVQGKPRFPILNEEYNIITLDYGGPAVYLVDDKVIGYRGLKGLKIKYNPLPKNPSNTFRLGSSFDEIVSIHGLPNDYIPNEYKNQLYVIASYEFENLFFKNGILVKYEPSDWILRFIPINEKKLFRYDKNSFKLGMNANEIYKKFGKPDRDFYFNYGTLTFKYKDFELWFDDSNKVSLLIENKKENKPTFLRKNKSNDYNGYTVNQIINKLGEPISKSPPPEKRRIIQYKNVNVILRNNKVIHINYNPLLK